MLVPMVDFVQGSCGWGLLSGREARSGWWSGSERREAKAKFHGPSYPPHAALARI